MLAEGLQKLIDTARESITAQRAVHFPDVKGLPANQVIKVKADGSHEIITLDPPPRTHTLRSVSEIASFVTYSADRLSGLPSVWVDSDGVTILITDDQKKWRMDAGRIKLKYSPQFANLHNWESRPEDFEHREFLKMLQRYYSQNESIANLPALLKMLRKLQFDNGVAIVSTADNKRQSLGKEITAAVKGSDASELPEVLKVILKVYDDEAAGQLVGIDCMLDITPAGQFRLIPLAGTTKMAIDVTLESIRRDFVAELPQDVPVFFGTP